MSEEIIDQQIQIGRTKVLQGHIQSIGSVFVKDNLIISGSWDRTIKIWNINSGECRKTLEGDTMCVNSLF